MHPILLRIPLPHTPLKLWWALVAVIAIATAYAIAGAVRRERSTLVQALVVAGAAALAAAKWHAVSYEAEDVPIYAYGVMLAISLVIGWFLSLTLADRDGLPRETMANCYVVTALAAIAGSRVLYILTNLDEFHSIWDLLSLRNGGLVAYGGFIGGLIGSWAYLAGKRIRLLAWADEAVPSLASGLLVTRIGCYLFGCDFGKRLPAGAPHWLQRLGTFPHWAAGTLVHGDGSPAFIRHLDVYRDTPLAMELERMNASFPVHPTQLYESLSGLLLLGLVFWQRRIVRFRGQVFFVFVFAYGLLRFLLELFRDDVERGSYGPTLDAEVYIPLCLVLLALGFAFGMSRAIANERARIAAVVVAFLPAVGAYLALRPGAFAASEPYQLSTSQLIGVASALVVSYFYGRFWEEARVSPIAAMSLGDPGVIRELRGEPPARASADGDAPPEQVAPEPDASEPDAPEPDAT